MCEIPKIISYFSFTDSTMVDNLNFAFPITAFSWNMLSEEVLVLLFPLVS